MLEEDCELLRRYVEEKSDLAFAELVRRHLDLVYGVALRQVAGDAALAQDVTQIVFTALARKAGALKSRPVLSGWLYRATQFAAVDAVRAESRRRARESAALAMNDLPLSSSMAIDWDRLRPTLEQAIGDLDDEDRDAVVLRFFEGKSFAAVGGRLRLTENAARMRVERALDKLHAALARRGVTSTAAALAAGLGSQSGVAAPPGLAASVAAAAMAGAGGGLFTGAVWGLLLGAAGVVVAATGIAIERQTVSRSAAAALVALEREEGQLQARLAGAEAELAAAAQRAQAADADALRLLRAIQEAAPAAEGPPDGAVGLAFVFDTSGSMRNPATGKLWPAVYQAVCDMIEAHPDASFLMGADADGRPLFGGGKGWLPRTAESLQVIQATLDQVNQDTVSDPLPGIYRVMRTLPPASTGPARLRVCVIGDEYNAASDEATALRRLDELNPRESGGRRRATISAVQLPTTVQSPGGPMGKTGLRFQTLLQEVARQHGGTYRLLPATSPR
jgi:RNA polymerase sigma factor (sigma-70 family)